MKLPTAAPLLALGTIIPSLHATVIKPVGVTTTITGDAGSSHLYLLDDNAGSADISLQDETFTGTAVTLDTGTPIVEAICALAARSGAAHAESWTSPTPAGNPVFVFDLTGGGDTDIGSILLWQYGNNGGTGPTNGGNATRGFSLLFHTEAEGNTFDFGSETIDFSGVMDPVYGDSPLENVAQPFFFGSLQSARYVALRIDSNYLPPADPVITFGGDRYGLGEVRFATEFEVNPRIVVPASLQFTNNGAVQTVAFDIDNTGASEDLTVTGIALTGLDATAFTAVTDLSGPLVIGAGSSTTVEFNFNPSGIPVGVPLEAVFEIVSNGWFKPEISLPVDGTIRDPWIESAEIIDLGTILPGSGAMNFTVTVENLGVEDLLLSDGVVDGSLAFEIVDDLVTNPVTIPGGGMADLTLSFDPTGFGGQLDGTLTLTSDDPVVEELVIDLTALVARDPEASYDATVDIGPLAFGAGAMTIEIPVENVATVNALTIDNVVVDLDDPFFAVQNVPGSIAPGETGTIVLSFDPQGRAGCFTTTLIFDTNDLGDEFPEVPVSVTIAPQDLPGGLVAWWSMDNDADPGADASGNGFHANPVLVEGLSPETGANGTTNGALRFSTGNHLEVPQCEFLNPESFTVVGWACPDASTGIQSLITSRYDAFAANGNTYGFICYIIGGNWEFWNGTPIGGLPWAIDQIGPPTAAAWQHIAFSYDSATTIKSVYLNGNLVSSLPAAEPYQRNLETPLHIGAGGDLGTAFPFIGKLDDIAIFSTVLAPGEISTIASGGVESFLNPVENLQIELVSYDGTNLVINVTGGLPGKTYKVTSSTNLTLPFADTGVTFDSTSATGITVPTGSNTVFFVRAEEAVFDN